MSTSLTTIKPLCLVGFMASGKSTVGKELAQLLHWDFVDLDQQIEAEIGTTIGAYILAQGEPAFRTLETNALKKVILNQHSVIALGGGAFTQEINRSLIATNAHSIWLDAPFELCWQRIVSDQTVRPLAPDPETARLRFQQRTALYQLAQIHIQVTSNQSAQELAQTILNHLN